MNVLFVCTGNTCRSPMAEHLFRFLLEKKGIRNWTVASAGVAPALWLDMPTEAQEALREEGVKDIQHHPKDLSPQRMKQADLVWVMENHHKTQVLNKFPEAKAKVHLLKSYADPSDSQPGISDPFGQSPAVYKKTLAEIKKALLTILEKPDFQK